jgi:hypothetical protein
MQPSPPFVNCARRIAEAATGRRVPQALTDSGCVVALHEMLLDWQGDVLAGPALVPGARGTC